MYTVKATTKFQKDLKTIQKRGYNISLLTNVVKIIANGETIPPKYQDHELKGNYKGCRELHITPDWLLIYEIDKERRLCYI